MKITKKKNTKIKSFSLYGILINYFNVNLKELREFIRSFLKEYPSKLKVTLARAREYNEVQIDILLQPHGPHEGT